MIEKLFLKRTPLLIFIGMSIFFIQLLSSNLWAQTVIWLGSGDAVSFEDAANWSPEGTPTSKNDADITLRGANIVTTKTFALQSLFIGGKENTTLSINEFVSGELSPKENTGIALYIKKGGEVVLKGAGQIKLTGTFKNSEEALINSPAFMFMAQ